MRSSIRPTLVLASGVATAVVLCLATSERASAQAQAAYVCDAFPVPGGSQYSPVITTKSGTVWYADVGGNRLVRVNADHTTAAVVPVDATTSQLSGIALAADGAIWYGKDKRRLGHVPPGGGKGVEYELLAPSLFTSAIATSADGRTWFADAVKNGVGYMAPGGNVTLFDAPVVNGSPASPAHIAIAADGSAWVTSVSHNAIYRVDPTSGTFTRHDIDTPDAQPSVIVPGPHGTLWFLMPAVHKVGRITLDGTITEYETTLIQLGSLAEGPDGAMWISSRQGIGKIDTSTARVTTYPCGGFNGMTIGPDHHLWVLGDAHMYVVRALHEGARARVTTTSDVEPARAGLSAKPATIETVSADTIRATLAHIAGRAVVAYTSEDPGCGDCTVGNRHYASLAASAAPNVRYLRVLFEPYISARDSAEATRMQLVGLPTFVTFKSGSETARYDGDAPVAMLRAKLGL